MYYNHSIIVIISHYHQFNNGAHYRANHATLQMSQSYFRYLMKHHEISIVQEYQSNPFQDHQLLHHPTWMNNLV